MLNERTYAQSALASGELGKKPSEAVGRIMRMWHADGMSTPDIKNNILSFLSEHAPDLSLPRWEPAIERQIKLLDKFQLIELDEIPITQREIDTILALGGRMHRRLAFTLLCLAKFRNTVNEKNNNWAGRNDKEAMQMANIRQSVVAQAALFRELRNAGLIKFALRVDNLNVQVLFIDTEGETAYSVTDMRNLGNQFHAIEGESFFNCQRCGICTKQNKAGSRKYCLSCEKLIPPDCKSINCVDCNLPHTVLIKDSKRTRCDKCQATRDLERKREWKREWIKGRRSRQKS